MSPGDALKRLPVMTAVAIAFIVPSFAMGVPGVASAAPGPCPDANGVTVVVDFGRLGGGVQVGCAPGDPGNGADALRGAGFSVEGTVRMPAFLCRINGRPSPGEDACVMPPPPHAYWSYWVADRSRAWCYSNAGMMGRNPVPGTVEGWVFTSGAGPSAPRSSTFSRLAGAGTTGVDCDTSAAATTVPTPAPPPPQAPAARPARPPAVPAPGPPPPSVSGAAPAPPAPGGAAGGDPVGSGGSAPTGEGANDTAATTTSTTATTTTTTAAGGERESGSEGTAPGGSGDGNGTGGSEEAGSSTVELSDSGRSGPGSPLGTGIAVGGIAAIGIAAFIVNRRRFSPVPPDPDGGPSGPTTPS